MSERAFSQKQKYIQLPSDELNALVEYMQSLRLDKHEAVAIKKPVQEANITGENGTCLNCHSNAGHMS